MGSPGEANDGPNQVEHSGDTQAELETTQQPARDLPQAALDLAARIFDMARTGNKDMLDQYLRAGISPNLTNASGDTLLMLAAYHGHTDTARYLLSMGADPNVLNDRGQSPIAGAVFKGWDDVVELLFRGVENDGLIKEGSKADIRLGQPNAIDSAGMFRRESYLRLFGVEEASERPWERER